MIGLPTADDVLAFWFGTAPIAAPRAAWFDKSDAFDAEVRACFLPLWEALCAGNADTWMDTPLEAIARIVVLDQFPRNMFRGAPRAFASDAAALHTARIVVAAGWDAELPTRFHRMFCYLPFEHSEVLAVQDESIRLFTRLRDQEGMPIHWCGRTSTATSSPASGASRIAMPCSGARRRPRRPSSWPSPGQRSRALRSRLLHDPGSRWVFGKARSRLVSMRRWR